MSERVVRNVENDYLMCSICLGRYRDPRLIPCGHTFCRQCLEDHIKQTVTDRGARFFMCPNDRTQVACPSAGLAPKDWAGAFPVDTFLSTLLNAVMIHASPSTEGNNQLTCETHKGRLKEFFCLGCRQQACAYCVIKSHKKEQCDCVGLEEAVEKFRPTIEILRLKLQKQIQRAKKVSRGESTAGDSLKASKDHALRMLTDFETKLTFYFQTAAKQLEDMKKRVREAGQGQMTETQQVSAILSNMSETAGKLEETCNHGSAADILNIVPKVDEQTKEYDEALKRFGANSAPLQIRFESNRQLESMLEDFPRLGSVVVVGGNSDSKNSGFSQAYNSAMSNMPFLATPRQSATPRTSVAAPVMCGGRPCGVSRRRSCPGREQRAPRQKQSFTLRTWTDSCISCFQLTGVLIVNSNVLMTDAHNGMIVRCDMTGSPSSYDQMDIECPVCIAPVQNSSDVIVTLPESSQFAFIRTEASLSLKETVDTQKPYEGICKLPGSHYAVSCCVVGKQCIEVVDITGRVLKSFNKDDAGRSLFSWPRFLSSTPSGQILVSDRDQKTLISLDQSSGAVQWSYSTAASPWGVSCHESGNIYLCLDNNTVQVVSEQGRLVHSKFLTAQDGVKIPYAIHAHGASLALTEWGSSLFTPNSPWVHVFTI